MQVPLVMTIIGRDRPGLVDLVSGLIAKHGGNWLESQMSRLGGHFAGILRIEVPRAQQTALVEALHGLTAEGLSVVCHADAPEAATGQPASVRLELVGQDRPGIVSQISHALARHGVNVEELTTECSSAPMSGETLFKAQALLHVPASCHLAELRDELEKIAADLVVDVTLQPIL
jgi:glycine cleavage system regulatory protein